MTACVIRSVEPGRRYDSVRSATLPAEFVCASSWMKTVSNKTRGWSRAVVDVSIAYGEDVDRAINVIRDEAERLAALFGFAREGNRLLDEGRMPGAAVREALALADAVLDVMPAASGRLEVGLAGAAPALAAELSEQPPASEASADAASADAWALAWAGRRHQARLDRNYPESDRIRALLRAAGYDVRDGRSGVEIVRL